MLDGSRTITLKKGSLSERFPQKLTISQEISNSIPIVASESHVNHGHPIMPIVANVLVGREIWDLKQGALAAEIRK
jgi:hypothetical protein